MRSPMRRFRSRSRRKNPSSDHRTESSGLSSRQRILIVVLSSVAAAVLLPAKTTVALAFLPLAFFDILVAIVTAQPLAVQAIDPVLKTGFRSLGTFSESLTSPGHAA